MLRLKKIFHPTDYTEASVLAFYHGLKIALNSNASITIMQVDNDSSPSWDQYPGVRRTLFHWNLLPKKSKPEDIAKLGLRVKKIRAKGENPTEVIQKQIKKSNYDLLVLSTQQRKGMAKFLKKSVAEPVSRNSRITTLFVPQSTEGFISKNAGEINLRNILFPVNDQPNPQPALNALAVLAKNLKCKRLSIHLLHIGKPKEIELVLPNEDGWHFHHVNDTGDVVQAIVNQSIKLDSDLIVLATQGHDSLMDSIMGNTTEQIVREVTCPVLAVPSSTYTE